MTTRFLRLIIAGNKKFRQIVEGHIERYQEAHSKLDKSMIISSIVERVHQNGGRFVRHRSSGNKNNIKWLRVPDKVAREKAGQALRIMIRNTRRSSDDGCGQKKQVENAIIKRQQVSSQAAFPMNPFAPERSAGQFHVSLRQDTEHNKQLPSPTVRLEAGTNERICAFAAFERLGDSLSQGNGGRRISNVEYARRHRSQYEQEDLDSWHPLVIPELAPPQFRRGSSEWTESREAPRQLVQGDLSPIPFEYCGFDNNVHRGWAPR